MVIMSILAIKRVSIAFEPESKRFKDPIIPIEVFSHVEESTENG